MERPRPPLRRLLAVVVLAWACGAPAPGEGEGSSAAGDAGAAAPASPSPAEQVGAPGTGGDPQSAPGDLLAAQGVFDDSIVFGQSAALSGATEGLGTDMRLGVLAAFEEANREGGVHGRLLKLQSRDDRYESELAVENTRELIDSVGVFGLIGAVGTPTSNVAEPIASENGVPYIGAFTGASLLRRDDQRYVVNLRASYNQETEWMVERLTTDLGFSRIAILYQDDTYGLAGLNGVMQALERRDMALVGTGTYVRNTIAVKRALLRLQESRPQAVIIIGAYRPAAEFIRWARKTGLGAVFVNLSFVGSNGLLDELGESGEGVVVTQVVPLPRGTSIPVVAAYQAALRAVDGSAQPGFVSLEGYLAGRLVVQVLGMSTEPDGDPPTREAFLQTLAEAGPIDLGGFMVEYGPDDNQGSDEVFLTVIRQGRFVRVDELSR
ncbi:MAG: ABC transporter substrate-binding protein [Gemmatimonadetes bacterium]|nr:ABC transporter substrate-binding protein [Gemmatimonadota bacterium]MYE71242.1 ABC transporter substrate-binding protein [Gemmatimonadota bacterium]MYJ69830.1 ABC transporter substrate-binding protein [Gemmatimonadota bacterium]